MCRRPFHLTRLKAPVNNEKNSTEHNVSTCCPAWVSLFASFSQKKNIFKFWRSIMYSITSELSLACGGQTRQLQAGCPKPLPIGVSKNCPFTQSDFACDSLTMRCAALQSSQRFCVVASASPFGFQCRNSTTYSCHLWHP